LSEQHDLQWKEKMDGPFAMLFDNTQATFPSRPGFQQALLLCCFATETLKIWWLIEKKNLQAFPAAQSDHLRKVARAQFAARKTRKIAMLFEFQCPK